jgi:hypothetical protein
MPGASRRAFEEDAKRARDEPSKLTVDGRSLSSARRRAGSAGVRSIYTRAVRLARGSQRDYLRARQQLPRVIFPCPACPADAPPNWAIRCAALQRGSSTSCTDHTREAPDLGRGPTWTPSNPRRTEPAPRSHRPPSTAPHRNRTGQEFRGGTASPPRPTCNTPAKLSWRCQHVPHSSAVRTRRVV